MGIIEDSYLITATLHCLLHPSLLPNSHGSKVQVLYTQAHHNEKANTIMDNSEAMHAFKDTMQHLSDMVLCCKAVEILNIPRHFYSPLICCSNISFYTYSAALALHILGATPGTYLNPGSTCFRKDFISSDPHLHRPWAIHSYTRNIESSFGTSISAWHPYLHQHIPFSERLRAQRRPCLA